MRAKTPRRRLARKSVRKSCISSKKQKSSIVRTFIDILNTVKIYHWGTHSYAEHKATDELYERLNANIDRFVEVLLGKDESRIRGIEQSARSIETKSRTDFKTRIYQYRRFLSDMDRCLDSERDSDLMSIRDDILADVNQFLYLMTFR